MEFLKRQFFEYNKKSYYLPFESLYYFNDYCFYENKHIYTYKKERVEKSVTELTSRFIEPFNEAKWLPKKAKEYGISEEDLKAEWKHKADISTLTGTLFHKYMEYNLAGKIFVADETTIPQTLKEEVFIRYKKLIPYADDFLIYAKENFVPVKSEFIVGFDTHIAGQIDQIFYNKTTKQFDIYDWKTNKEINCWNKWHKKMLGPFQHLDECELNSYSLQLSIYKWLLEKQGFEVDKLNLVWFNENNKSYQIMPCKDLSNQVESIILQ